MKTGIDPTHLDAFERLRNWCRDNQVCIYSESDGNVWICIKDTHYRAQMIGSKFSCWEPFERVEFERVWKEDK